MLVEGLCVGRGAVEEQDTVDSGEGLIRAVY